MNIFTLLIYNTSEWEVGGLEWSPLGLMRTNEEQLEWESSGFGLELYCILPNWQKRTVNSSLTVVHVFVVIANIHNPGRYLSSNMNQCLTYVQHFSVRNLQCTLACLQHSGNFPSSNFQSHTHHPLTVHQYHRHLWPAKGWMVMTGGFFMAVLAFLPPPHYIRASTATKSVSNSWSLACRSHQVAYSSLLNSFINTGFLDFVHRPETQY
jgi:hypothetical protein